MLIILGTTVKITKGRLKNYEEKICPFCSEKFQVYEKKQYFTLFFIPVFPLKKISAFYKCPKCNYTININNNGNFRRQN